MKLDLACGRNPKAGYLGVDKSPEVDPDIVCDLEQYPWPWPDASIEAVYCSHYVEHVSNLILFMNELYRILVVGGEVEIIAPFYASRRAIQDPTHRQFVSETTFVYYSKAWREKNGLDHYGITADFDCSFRYRIADSWAGRSDKSLAFAVRHYWNVVEDLEVWLKKR